MTFSPDTRGFTLSTSLYPFARRAGGGRGKAKESAMLPVYPPPLPLFSLLARPFSLSLSLPRLRAATLVFAALAGKGLRLLAQAASTFARE